MQSSRAKDHASSVICAATHCHPLSIACSRRKTGREILDELQRLRLHHRLPLPLPALLGVGPAHRGALRICAHRLTGYSTCVIVRLNIGGFPSARLCPLDPVLSWDGLGRPWDGMHPCRVTRWPGPGSQRRSVAASQACKVGAREWAASATIEPRVWDACTPCLACWACLRWPAGPPVLALLAVSFALGPSPIQKTEYAIGLPYSQPSQSRLQRPSLAASS